MLHRVEDININNQDVIAILNKYKKGINQKHLYQ